MPVSNLTPEQQSAVLEKIAIDADAIAVIADELICQPGGEIALILPSVIHAMAQRIGWMADHLNGGAVLGGAEDWMLPGSYHAKGKRIVVAGTETQQRE